MDNPQHVAPQQKYWYWVTGKRNGETVLLGPYATRDEADEMGFDGFSDGVYKLHVLGTRSRPDATQALKHEIFSETRDLGLALQRFKHSTK